MSKREKLQRRLLAKPKDFTWSELTSLMTAMGFDIESSAGSGRKFIFEATGAILFIHEPHPAKVLKPYQIRDVIAFLERQGFLS